MEKSFEFGKVDYNNTGKRINAVDVSIELREKEGGKLEFAASGTIWNNRKTASICGGQCLDEIKKYIRSPLFLKIYRLWKLYHLNTMNAGTVKQDEVIKTEASRKGKNWLDYDEACKVLKEVNLYEDNGYRYGSTWLYREIPQNDLLEIKKLLGGENDA